MIKKWKVLKRSTYQHSPWRAIEDVTFEMPDGKEQTFSLKKEGHVVAIFALDQNKNVILTKQYRPGPDQVLDELPGGGVEKGESPLDAAMREFKEETGFESKDWIELGRPLECAYSTITRHAFLAKDCYQTSQELSLDDNEYIEVVLKPLNEFFEQLSAGQCTDLEVAWMGLFEMGLITVS